jgi:hypothetical protein
MFTPPHYAKPVPGRELKKLPLKSIQTMLAAAFTR